MVAQNLRKKLILQAAAVAVPIVLAGCSSVPDAVNPVEWYRSTVDYFDDDEAEVAARPTSSAPSEVAEAAAQAPKKEVESGFVAAQPPARQYAQPVMRQGDVVNPLGETQVVKTDEPPAPQAAPTMPVTTSEIVQSEPVPSVSVNQPDMMKAPVLTPPAPQPVDPYASTAPQRPQSVQEIFAANIAQTRPTQMAPMTNDPYGFGSQSYDTVVVTSGGVSRQQPQVPTFQPLTAQQPVQMAAVNATASSSMTAPSTAAMMAEPGVVREGRAHSMQTFNRNVFRNSFQVATIQFGNGSARLTAEDIRILREVLNVHQQQGGVIRVVGHASSRTRDMGPQQHAKVNMSMSLGRADMVARELLKLGLPGERLYVGGLSDSQPLYREVMPSGEAGNRRTEIYVDY